MAKHPAAWWAKRVEELQKVGDPEEVARRHDVNAKTLVWWRAELARRAREASAGGPRLLPVVIEQPRSEAGRDVRELEVVVEIGAARLSLRGAVTGEHLGAIVGKLAASC